ncbi:MAG: hypothetical protein ACE14V_10725 [bacterium]
MADFAPSDGAIMVGMIVSGGYLLVFPFWMIRKLSKLGRRINLLQEDIDDQTTTIKSCEQRIDGIDHDLEEQRKTIGKAFTMKSEE